jgi:hypothetical protein
LPAGRQLTRNDAHLAHLLFSGTGFGIVFIHGFFIILTERCGLRKLSSPPGCKNE